MPINDAASLSILTATIARPTLEVRSKRYKTKVNIKASAIATKRSIGKTMSAIVKLPQFNEILRGVASKNEFIKLYKIISKPKVRVSVVNTGLLTTRFITKY